MRDIKNRYLGSLSGLAWVFLHPVLLLTMYTFLIAGVLKARIPGLTDSQWLPFVALGLWPWMCFSEGLQRATSAVIEHAGLLGKVALPTELLVAASVCATFSLHVMGLVAALIVLALFGYPINLWNLPWLLLMLVLLLGFTLGASWIAAGLQVYMRDVGQLLGQALSFAFFLTPILYSAHMMPESLRFVFIINPLSFYCDTARALMLEGWTSQPGGSLWVAVLIVALILLVGFNLFKRLARHFEDFL